MSDKDELIEDILSEIHRILYTGGLKKFVNLRDLLELYKRANSRYNRIRESNIPSEINES